MPNFQPTSLEPFRRQLFLHQDGFVLAYVLAPLLKNGLFEFIQQNPNKSLKSIFEQCKLSEGQANICLRPVAAQNWIQYSGKWGSLDNTVALTEKGKNALQLLPLYVDAGKTASKLYEITQKCQSINELMEHPQLLALKPEFELILRTIRDSEINTSRHFAGIILTPLMPFLKRHDGFHPLANLTRKTDSNFFIDLFESVEWLDTEHNQWTATGKEAQQFALHYGLAGSYQPMFSNLKDRLHPEKVKNQLLNTEENVDRTINVLASGAAHKSYFKNANAIFKDLFDRLPIQEQPELIVDIGCGDGTWIKEIYHFIKNSTHRGEALNEHPLTMIGVDYNQQALDVCKDNLAHQDIPVHLFVGDISKPEELETTLTNNNLSLQQALIVRSFIDHNRTYTNEKLAFNEQLNATPTGAYIDKYGDFISGEKILNNWVTHLQKWKNFSSKHGLVILEAHCLDPIIAAEHIGETHSIAFDTYHGLSCQYPVEYEAFMQAAEIAGLQPSTCHEYLYPSSQPFVTVSQNRFINPETTQSLPNEKYKYCEKIIDWQPNSNIDLDDGNDLHQLVYNNGELTRPRRWCSAPTGVVVRETISRIKEKIQNICEGNAQPKLHIVDYGAGSGFATIELIKACQEIGLFHLIDKHNIDFRIWLLDLPASWFAKGYELLHQYEFISFKSILDEERKFIPLESLFNHSIDIVFSSMVLHLIPNKALPTLVNGIHGMLEDDGYFIWSSPDSASGNKNTQVFHYPNRTMRSHALKLLSKNNHKELIQKILNTLDDKKSESFIALLEKLQAEYRSRTDEENRFLDSRANRQILPQPSQANLIEKEMLKKFSGEISHTNFEICYRDSLDAILIPSNLKYLPEVTSIEDRKVFIEIIMKEIVFKDIESSLSATTFGFNLRWTFGVYSPQPEPLASHSVNSA